MVSFELCGIMELSGYISIVMHIFVRELYEYFMLVYVLLFKHNYSVTLISFITFLGNYGIRRPNTTMADGN